MSQGSSDDRKQIVYARDTGDAFYRLGGNATLRMVVHEAGQCHDIVTHGDSYRVFLESRLPLELRRDVPPLTRRQVTPDAACGQAVESAASFGESVR